MLIFGIDTCCMAATAGIVEDGRLVAQTVVNRGKTHSQIMMPAVEEMFKIAQISPKDIDCFAAAVGPGSFTGVRIGVATAKALAQGVNKPCAAVSTLEALAVQNCMFDGILAPILDARRDQVYTALFKSKKGELERLCPDCAMALDDLVAKLLEMDEPVLFMGDGIFPFGDTVREKLGDRAYIAPCTTNMNLGGSVALLGEQMFKAGKTVTYGELVPSYVRLSQAERDLLEKNKAE